MLGFSSQFSVLSSQFSVLSSQFSVRVFGSIILPAFHQYAFPESQN